MCVRVSVACTCMNVCMCIYVYIPCADIRKTCLHTSSLACFASATQVPI